MQAGLMKGLNPGLGSLRVFLSLLCISAAFCFACAGFLCFQSPGGVTAGPELPHLHITVLTLLRLSYQFLSLLPIWGRDFPIDPFVSGRHHWPVSCGCFVIVDPTIRNASYGNGSQSGRHCTCLLLALI